MNGSSNSERLVYLDYFEPVMSIDTGTLDGPVEIGPQVRTSRIGVPRAYVARPAEQQSRRLRDPVHVLSGRWSAPARAIASAPLRLGLRRMLRSQRARVRERDTEDIARTFAGNPADEVGVA